MRQETLCVYRFASVLPAIGALVILFGPASASPAPRPAITMTQAGRGLVCVPPARPRGVVMVGLRMPVKITEAAGVDVTLVGVRAAFYRGDEEVARGLMTAEQLEAAGAGRVPGGGSITVTLAHDVVFPRASVPYDSFSYVATFREKRRSAINAVLEPPFDLAVLLPMACPEVGTRALR